MMGSAVARREVVDDIWRVEVVFWRLRQPLIALEQKFAFSVGLIAPLCILCYNCSWRVER